MPIKLGRRAPQSAHALILFWEISVLIWTFSFTSYLNLGSQILKYFSLARDYLWVCHWKGVGKQINTAKMGWRDILFVCLLMVSGFKFKGSIENCLLKIKIIRHRETICMKVPRKVNWNKKREDTRTMK